MPLSKQEERHLEAFEWLVSDGFTDEDIRNRAAGRSYLLSYCFIRKAMKHPNIWVRVWDHIPDHLAHEQQLRHVLNIINQDEEFKEIRSLIRINTMKNSIMIGSKNATQS